jgi:hypothetical protein
MARRCRIPGRVERSQLPHRQALVTARFVESFKIARSYFLLASAPKIKPDLRVEEDEQVADDFSRVFWCRLFATAHARS